MPGRFRVLTIAHAFFFLVNPTVRSAGNGLYAPPRVSLERDHDHTATVDAVTTNSALLRESCAKLENRDKILPPSSPARCFCFFSLWDRFAASHTRRTVRKRRSGAQPRSTSGQSLNPRRTFTPRLVSRGGGGGDG